MDSQPRRHKYFPFDGECEYLEDYEPGGFHPVHLNDEYDGGRYRIVHKLGFGGFSTVWLARDRETSRWVSLKVVLARESATYNSRSVISDHASTIDSRLFVVSERHFWIDGPNGRHICLVLPVLGSDLSKLSKLIYSRLKPKLARNVALQAAKALAQLHSHGLCHGDFTVSNMALRLVDDFNTYNENDLFEIFGRPQSKPVRTYSRRPPGPHAPDYIVVPLEFSASSTSILSDEISIIDFDQSFTSSNPSSDRPGIPARYLAPEAAVGRPLSPASDVWALGCAIFRLRSGDDLFFAYDTVSPYCVLQQIVLTLGDLPKEWSETRFDEDGYPVTDGGEGSPLETLELKEPLADKVHDIMDEPAGLCIDKHGAVAELPDEEPPTLGFADWAAMRVPYPEAMKSTAWKPTAVCVDGGYMTGYSAATNYMLKAFPKMSEAEASLLIDLLSKMFTYDPEKRLPAQEVMAHPWFQLDTPAE